MIPCKLPWTNQNGFGESCWWNSPSKIGWSSPAWLQVLQLLGRLDGPAVKRKNRKPRETPKNLDADSHKNLVNLSGIKEKNAELSTQDTKHPPNKVVN